MVSKIISIALILFSIYLNVMYIYTYLSAPSIRKVYAYSNFMIYSVFPVLVFSTIVVIYYFIISEKKGKLKSSLNALYVFYVLFFLGIIFYFKQKEKNINIIIKNNSSKNFDKVEVFARNNQYFVEGDFLEDNIIEFNCKCRDISFSDSIGVALLLKDQKTNVKIDVLSNNEPIYDEELIILILNDSVVYKSVQNGKYYQLLNKYAPLIPAVSGLPKN